MAVRQLLLLVCLLVPAIVAQSQFEDVGCMASIQNEQMAMRKAADSSRYDYSLIQRLAKDLHPECVNYEISPCDSKLNDVSQEIAAVIRDTPSEELVSALGIDSARLCENAERVRQCFAERKKVAIPMNGKGFQKGASLLASNSLCASISSRLARGVKEMLRPSSIERLLTDPTFVPARRLQQRPKRDEDGSYEGDYGNDNNGGDGSDSGDNSEDGGEDPGNDGPVLPEEPEDPAEGYYENELGGPPIDFGYTDVESTEIMNQPGYIIAIVVFISVSLLMVGGIAIVIRERIRKPDPALSINSFPL